MKKYILIILILANTAHAQTFTIGMRNDSAFYVNNGVWTFAPRGVIFSAGHLLGLEVLRIRNDSLFTVINNVWTYKPNGSTYVFAESIGSHVIGTEGGNTNQYLKKASNADYDFAWATPPNLSLYSTTAQADALYAAIGHNHTGVYQPVGSYLVAADIAGKMDKSDSATYQTKYRSDSARTNLYNAINGKQASGSYATTATTDSMRTNIYNGINGKQASGTYVTAVSVASANGITGSSSGGATPALTVTLGAITPTTVNGHTFTTGSSTYTGTAAKTYTFLASTATIPGVVATANVAAGTSAVSATTLFTPTVSGWYRISAFLKITTTGTSPVAGPVTITYTDPDGSVAQSEVMLLHSVTGTVVTTTVNNSTTTGTVSGTLVIYAKTGVAVQYAIAVSGTYGAGRYTAHLACESLQ